MEQKPQWDKLVPIPYIFDTKGYIAHLKTILGSGNPRFAKHDANINAVIAMYENGYEGGKKIFLIEGKQVGSLEEALLHEGPVWIEGGIGRQVIQKARYPYEPADMSFQLLLQCRLLTAYGGPGTIIQVPVTYDTGSNMLSLFLEDFFEMGFLLIPQYPSTGPVQIFIADGSMSFFEKYFVQWRLSEPETNIGWSAWVTEEAIFRPASPGASRLSGIIHQSFYIGSGPAMALSVATTRGGMSSQLN